MVKIIKREVKHSKLGTSMTRRMMPLRELQGRQNWERKGRDLTATELKMLVKGCWDWIDTLVLAFWERTP